MKRYLLPLLFLLATGAFAQAGALDELKASAAKNKEALAHYTWREEQTLTVDGDLKRTTVSTVALGADGQPVKTSVSQVDAPQKQVRGPLRNHIRERKTDEFKDYMKEVATLTQAYAHPDSEKLQAAYKAGNIKLGSAGQGHTQFTVTDYLKPGDTVVVVYDTAKKAILSVKVSSYLDKPDNRVDISTSFAQLTDGTNHLAQSKVIGQDKEVVIETKNSGYTKRG